MKSNGYLITAVNGKSQHAHRLVAAAFFANIEGLLVNHLNGNKVDNRIENLELVNHSQNAIHAFKNGLISFKNRIHHKAKLTRIQVAEIKKEILKNTTAKEIANKYGVDVQIIYLIKTGKTWKDVD